MSEVAHRPTVPNAMAGPITDKILESVIGAGVSAQGRDGIGVADAALILLTIAPIARELLHRRRAMGVIADMTDLENVTFLDAVRDNG